MSSKWPLSVSYCNENCILYVRSEGLTAVNIKITVLLDVRPCSPKDTSVSKGPAASIFRIAWRWRLQVPPTRWSRPLRSSCSNHHDNTKKVKILNFLEPLIKNLSNLTIVRNQFAWTKYTYPKHYLLIRSNFTDQTVSAFKSLNLFSIGIRYPT
jgi:hypothetical protein